jgi:prevent-host-death family protein
VVKRITATTASRDFSDILDRVEHAGEEFVVERHGRAVARLGPTASTPKRITIGEFVRSIESVPKPDESFIADVAEIRRRQPRLPKNPWPFSSTRRS